MKAIVTGGAGFIGCNTTARLMRDGYKVVVFDNLSRKGAEDNLAWLAGQGTVDFVKGDVRDFEQVKALIERHRDVDLIVHLAAQVAVTTSVDDPMTDFEINLRGTVNMLEAVRQADIRPFMVFASTNKVYGKMDDVPVVENDGRYGYGTISGVDEQRPVDFYSPYGCSKGAADQYVHDYHRIFGIPTCVFRMSCIYGPRQFGVEDQGWVAWFAIAAKHKQPITIYGDGKQVRDVLFVEDLVDLYLTAYDHREKSAGQIFNAGGGPSNVLSLHDLIAMLEQRLGEKIPLTFDDWRPGDQKVYVSEIGKAKHLLSWEPKVGKEEGVGRMLEWIEANGDVLRKLC